MTTKPLFKGPAIKSELIVLMLEKWGLHPELRELTATPDADDLGRDTEVLIPDAEHDRAHDILWGESEIERAGF